MIMTKVYVFKFKEKEWNPMLHIYKIQRKLNCEDTEGKHWIVSSIFTNFD